MEDSIMKLIFSGIVLWAAAFIFIRGALPKRSFSFCNRVVSSIHASLAVFLSILSVQDWSCPLCPLASKPSQLQTKTLAVTLSYLIYDLICCQFDEGFGFDNTVHHVVSIVGIGAGLAYKQCGSELVAALLITEVSSPCLHARELLKELGFKGTNLNLAFDILFAVSFSLARMVGGTYLTYVFLMADSPFLVKIMAMGMLLLSAFWFFKILRMMRYKLNRRIAAACKHAKVKT